MTYICMKKLHAYKRKRNSSARTRPFKRRKTAFKKTHFKKRVGNLRKKAMQSGSHTWLSFGRSKMWHSKNPVLRKTEKLIDPSYYLITTPHQYHCTAGTQIVANFGGCFTPYDIYNTVFGAGSVANTKAILDNCSMKVFGTNLANSNIFMDVYDCVVRKDFASANAASGLWTATDSGFTHIGASPFRAIRFTELIKMTKITRYNIGPGETFEHILHVKGPKLNDYQYTIGNAQISNVDQGGYEGVTHYIFATIMGTAFDDANTSISTTTPYVDTIVTKQYTWRLVTSSASTSTDSNTVAAATVLVTNPDTAATAQAEADR